MESNLPLANDLSINYPLETPLAETAGELTEVIALLTDISYMLQYLNNLLFIFIAVFGVIGLIKLVYSIYKGATYL